MPLGFKLVFPSWYISSPVSFQGCQFCYDGIFLLVVAHEPCCLGLGKNPPDNVVLASLNASLYRSWRASRSILLLNLAIEACQEDFRVFVFAGAANCSIADDDILIIAASLEEPAAADDVDSVNGDVSSCSWGRLLTTTRTFGIVAAPRPALPESSHALLRLVLSSFCTW